MVYLYVSLGCEIWGVSVCDLVPVSVVARGVLVTVVCVPRSLLVLCRLVVNLEEVKVIYGQNSCL